MPSDVARWDCEPVFDACQAAGVSTELVNTMRIWLTDDKGDIGVSGGDDANASKVPGRVLRLGDLGSRDGEQDGPADNTDRKDAGDGETSSLLGVRVGREQDHEDQGDGVRRDGEQLGVRSGFAEAVFDDRGKEARHTGEVSDWGKEEEGN
jgi:hypothetical protein